LEQQPQSLGQIVDRVTQYVTVTYRDGEVTKARSLCPRIHCRLPEAPVSQPSSSISGSDDARALHVSLLETPHQVEIVSQRPEQETLAFDEPVIVDHRENSYSHYCEGFTNSGDDYH